MREMYGHAFYTTDEIAILFGVTSRTIKTGLAKVLHFTYGTILYSTRE